MYFMGHANLLEGLQYYSRCGTQKTYRPYPGAEAIDAFADRLGEYKQKGAIQFPHQNELPFDRIE